MAKYSQNILKKVYDLYSSDSYTVKEVCSVLGIHKDTYYDWISNKPDFSDTIKKAKDEFDKNMLVEAKKSLSKLIRGYEYEEVKTVIVNKKEGEKDIPQIKEQTKIKKHVQPNLGAIIHFQTNVDPENWSNKQKLEHSGNIGSEIKITKEEVERIRGELDKDI